MLDADADDGNMSTSLAPLLVAEYWCTAVLRKQQAQRAASLLASITAVPVKYTGGTWHVLCARKECVFDSDSV